MAIPDMDRDSFTALADGVLIPENPPVHRDDEYDQAGFQLLHQMQQRHFWYRGRHRFLLSALRQSLRRRGSSLAPVQSGIDLGGGCGGWINYLKRKAPDIFSELSLGDSSLVALRLAGDVNDADVGRYQIDLLNLPWRDRWDVVFLLDVLEHIPQDVKAVEQIKQSLRPGGLLVVATPALKFFWSVEDDFAHHVRRYSRDDFAKLAKETGLELVLSRYFMFVLSPLLYLSRQQKRDVASMTPAQIREHQNRASRIPAWPVNSALSAAFGLESPLGVWLPFPWGTSVVGIFQKSV